VPFDERRSRALSYRPPVTSPNDSPPVAASDFIRDKVRAELAAGKYNGRVATRFPPEPNGYLHIGHAKSICLNFGIAAEFGGVCHLRMDDTNPSTEDPEYVAAIQRDVKWLGFDWGENMFYASDYYEALYELAEKLITLGRAYVCDLTEEQMSEYRGTVTEAGKNSPYRDRSVEENLSLFRRMRKGEFAEGSCVLRAKIDMSSPNMKMRDPPIYRIKHAHHYRTGDKWCIYPLYDFAHCLSDSMERITHSICTMEFESARELYDWVIEATGVPWVPKQTEFARLNLSYTVMSKRKLLELVEGKHVAGWDDPRLPTIAGLRRRGIRPEAIREFCARIGVAKNLSTVDVALLEHIIREDLEPCAPRVLGVLDPLKVVIENYPENGTEEFEAALWPKDIPREGSRKIPFSREVYIDREDFLEDPPKDFHRLAPGRSVRLRYAYVVTCNDVIKDASGKVIELRCTYDANTRGGATPSGAKKLGTIQWVSAAHALDVEVRIYDRLFNVEQPGTVEGRDFKDDLNPGSLTVLRAKVEPSLASAKQGDRVQFERVGFFIVDEDSRPDALVFNRIIALRDTYAKETPSRERQRPDTKRDVKERPAGVPVLSPEAAALKETYKVSDDEARALSTEPALTGLLDGALGAGGDRAATVTFLVNEVLRELRAKDLREVPFGGAELAELLTLVADGTLSNKLAKDVLSAMFAGEGPPRAIVDKRGLKQTTDESAIVAAIDRVIANNADAVDRYRKGNQNVIGALIGLCIKETAGRANPKLVGELLRKQLAS
jgi:glutaminyl-tRNA synthetase